jgi:hypothetical protein
VAQDAAGPAGLTPAAVPGQSRTANPPAGGFAAGGEAGNEDQAGGENNSTAAPAAWLRTGATTRADHGGAAEPAGGSSARAGDDASASSGGGLAPWMHPAGVADAAGACDAPASLTRSGPAAAASAAPLQEAGETGRPQTVRELAVRITNDAQQSAEVRMVERGGAIQVTVRASDPAAAEALRTDVTRLVSRLAEHDISAELWRPAAAAQSGASSEPGHSDTGRAPYGHSGGQDGDQGGRGQRHRDGGDAPAWLEEMEAGTHMRAARRNNS